MRLYVDLIVICVHIMFAFLQLAIKLLVMLVCAALDCDGSSLPLPKAQHHPVPSSAIFCPPCTALHCTALALPCPALPCPALLCIPFYCILLFCRTYYCTIFYYTSLVHSKQYFVSTTVAQCGTICYQTY